MILKSTCILLHTKVLLHFKFACYFDKCGNSLYKLYKQDLMSYILPLNAKCDIIVFIEHKLVRSHTKMLGYI